jgi:tetratricopeptide (TPR) repeat protein
MMAGGAEGVGCAPEANAAKLAGNAAFQAGRHHDAVTHFTEALLIDANSALLRSNRAGALSSLGRHTEALADAEVCIALQPEWWKGYSRRGHAQFHLGRHAESDESFQRAQQLNPCGDSKVTQACLSASTKEPSDVACFAPTATVVGGFVRPSEEEVQRRLERGVEQLGDRTLDDELRIAGVAVAPGATRAEKEQLFVCAEGAAPQGPSAVDTESRPWCRYRCCCHRGLRMEVAPKAAPTTKKAALSRGEKLLERRRLWLEKWSGWDDGRLLKRLRQLGVDASGFSRDQLMDILLKEETERHQRKRCTPRRLQTAGIFGSGAAILGTFVALALLFTTGST